MNSTLYLLPLGISVAEDLEIVMLHYGDLGYLISTILVYTSVEILAIWMNSRTLVNFTDHLIWHFWIEYSII